MAQAKSDAPSAKIRMHCHVRQGGEAHPDAPRKTWSRPARRAEILAQVVAIFGTIMAIADTLHRW